MRRRSSPWTCRRPGAARRGRCEARCLPGPGLSCRRDRSTPGLSAGRSARCGARPGTGSSGRRYRSDCGSYLARCSAKPCRPHGLRARNRASLDLPAFVRVSCGCGSDQKYQTQDPQNPAHASPYGLILNSKSRPSSRREGGRPCRWPASFACCRSSRGRGCRRCATMPGRQARPASRRPDRCARREGQ